MGFHYSFADGRSPQVFWTPLSILDELNNAVVWRESIIIIIIIIIIIA